MRFDPHIHPTVRSAAECNNDSIVPVDPASLQLADLPPPQKKKNRVKGVVNIRIYKHSSATSFLIFHKRPKYGGSLLFLR